MAGEVAYKLKLLAKHLVYSTTCQHYQPVTCSASVTHSRLKSEESLRSTYEAGPRGIYAHTNSTASCSRYPMSDTSSYIF